MANTVSLALLGCGRVAQHYRTILGSGVVEGYHVGACCDLDATKAGEMAARLGGETYTSIDDLLAGTAADLYMVLTPSGLHFDHAKRLLEAGKHILIEKPITMRPADADALASLARERNLMCAPVFQNRYNPAIKALRAAIDQGRFGKIVMASMRLHWCRMQDYYDDGWHGTWAMDGGVINQQAIHHVDALNWLLGPISEVCAAEEQRVNRLEAEDTMAAVVRFANGALGTIEATTGARPRDFEAAINVIGEKAVVRVGGIALNEIHEWSFVEPRPEDVDARERYSQEVPTGYGIGHGPLLNDIIARLAAGRIDPPISVADAASAVRLIHALYASVERGTWMRLGDQPVSMRLGKAA